MRDEENDRPAFGKRDPLEVEAMSERIPEPYDPLTAFGSFTRDELIGSIGDWIKRCDKAELELSEALALCNAANERIEHLTQQLNAQAVRTIEAERMLTEIDWSWIRGVLLQGTSIQQDYHAGLYPTYEHYSARLDEAAREIVGALTAVPAGQFDPTHEPSWHRSRS